ncbi:CBO2463/CBO2479 domain-containing protein [Azotosporobacter soli]|uniref:CBO2463/CBO2479 domain-containing protein n=1 Tax=Azotosporobacter soli TaxID=3055040 RepID=UPI0031FE722C
MDIELTPRLVNGKLVEVTEVGVKIEINGRLGMLSVPLRMVFTDKPLVVGDEVEFYVSYVNVTSK